MIQGNLRRTIVVMNGEGEDVKDEILHRVSHYVPQLDHSEIDFFEEFPDVAPDVAVLYLGNEPPTKNNFFNVDYNNFATEGWQWARFASFVTRHSVDVDEYHRKFTERIESLMSLNKKKAYIFGTGPSLEKAIDNDWSDGYTIVCNTIVRDQKLWNHIKPDFIVAGDAVYHFSKSKLATAFREDLKLRLKETDSYFVYPALFDALAQRLFAEFKEQLMPIPIGDHKSIHLGLTNRFELPAIGNILNLALLPLGCTMSKDVYLWGFNGRAPDDKLFWSNSKLHSYPEFMDDLQEQHPMFFSYYIPKGNEKSYVENVHGDILEKNMIDAEKNGWTFTMMHQTWTPVLQSRYCGSSYKLILSVNERELEISNILEEIHNAFPRELLYSIIMDARSLNEKIATHVVSLLFGFYTRARIMSNLKLLRSKRLRILDIGSGTGVFHHFMRHLGHDVVSTTWDEKDHEAYLHIRKYLDMEDMKQYFVEPFKPLPSEFEVFDRITCLSPEFNQYWDPDNIWGIEEWKFLINDLLLHLEPNGLLCFAKVRCSQRIIDQIVEKFEGEVEFISVIPWKADIGQLGELLLRKHI